MSFLVMGVAERLIYDAVELAAKGPARYGETLTDVLGHNRHSRSPFHVSGEGLTAGKWRTCSSADELRVEVMRLRGGPAAIPRLGLRTRQPSSRRPQGLHTALVHLGTAGEGADPRSRITRGWEHEADEVLTGLRRTAVRMKDGTDVATLVAVAG